MNGKEEIVKFGKKIKKCFSRMWEALAMTVSFHFEGMIWP